MNDTEKNTDATETQQQEPQDTSIGGITQEKLFAEAKRIYDELQLINSHKIVRVYDSVPKLIFFQFMKGVSFGLGSVVGATIVVSLLAYLLSHIEFVPILGEWVNAILSEIQQH